MESKQKLYSRTKPICRLSDLSKPHTLCRRYDPPLSSCFACNIQHLEDRKYYYLCLTCNVEFHRGCHKTPPQIKHPYHPLHPLTLIWSPDYTTDDNISDLIPRLYRFNTSDSEDSDIDETKDYVLASFSSNVCKCCRKTLRSTYYHCSICNFSLNYHCAIETPPVTISNFKCHNHILTLFPKRIPLPCDACGLFLDDALDQVYACLPCSFMIHRKCIYLPRVIKITRHQHRLSLTPLLPPADFLCGVCRQAVNINHGQFSCNKGCHYAVHSKCATRKDVWDGNDLEDVPEEPEEDVEPYVRIDEETIQHFSHQQHYLKLKESEKDCLLSNGKFCEACCIPITIKDHSIYSCMECDFILHETCAYLLRKKHHPAHRHPLILHPISTKPYDICVNDFVEGVFKCDGCGEKSCGFVYQCGEKDCKFQLDSKCASLTDPLIHGSHPHDLYFNLTKGKCFGCKTDDCSPFYLECIQSKTFLGLSCATFPSVAYYKHDTHPLTLCYGEESSDGQYWCEVCELKLDAKTWFYCCDSCKVTLHVQCLLGKELYMKPNHIIKVRESYEVELGRNDGNSRPFCHRCRLKCIDMFVFKRLGKYYCNLSCACWGVGDEIAEKRRKSGAPKVSIIDWSDFVPLVDKAYS